MLNITSRENKLIKHMVKLSQSRRYRHDSGEFVTEGDKLSWEAAAGLGGPVQLLLTEQALEKGGKMVETLLERCETAALITGEISHKLSTTEAPQGVFCLWKMPKQERNLKEISAGKYLILSGLQDPGNVGTIIRSGEAFGLEGIILSADCPDLYSPKLLRSTMGGIFRLPLYISEDLTQDIPMLKDKGFAVYGAALHSNSQDITKVDLTGNVAVVIGNEGNGIPEPVLSCCTCPIIIRMKGNAESLNAGVAASIAAWEMVR